MRRFDDVAILHEILERLLAIFKIPENAIRDGLGPLVAKPFTVAVDVRRRNFRPVGIAVWCTPEIQAQQNDYLARARFWWVLLAKFILDRDKSSLNSSRSVFEMSGIEIFPP